MDPAVPLGLTTSASGDASLQLQAVQNAKDALLAQTNGSLIFQQCLESHEPIPSLVQTLIASHEQHASKRITRLIGKFQTHTLWLQNMAVAIDVASNASPGFICPVWAPLRYILKVSKDHVEAAECILRMIDTISECLPRIRIYEKLKSHPTLQTALRDLYISIIDFSILTLKYFNRNAFSRAFRLIRRNFESDFSNILSRLRRHAKAIDETAIADELLLTAQYRQKTDKIYHQDLKIRCAEWLQPSSVRECHQRNLAERLDRTCEWILRDSKFSHWSNPPMDSSDTKKLLFICGGPGCGKTILASWIMAHLESQSKNVLYFPFSSTDPARQSTRHLICTLVWQALLAVEDDTSWNLVHDLMTKGPPTLSELWAVFIGILKSHQGQIFLVIDGADECSELDELLETRITQLLQEHSNLHVALIGRQRILQHHQAFCSSKVLLVTPSNVEEDIDAFIKYKISHFPVLQLQGMSDKVFKTLRSQSEGMFLWVRLMIDDLRKSSSAAELSFRLVSLPRGLSDAYQHIIRRLNRSLEHDPLAINLVRNILAFTVVCRQQMSFPELRYALALDSMLRSNLPGYCVEDFLPQYSAEQLQDICGNLITISDDRVRLLHSSLKEFLTKSKEEGSREKDHSNPSFCVDLNHAHRLLAAACVRYLGLGDYGLPWQDAACLPIKRAQNPFLKYSSKHALFHIGSSGPPCSILVNAITDFLRSERCVSWVEHFFLDMADDLTFTQVLLDFDEFIAWLLGSDRFEETLREIMTMLNQEMDRRLQLSNSNDSSTERWALFMRFAQDHILIAPDTEVPQSETQAIEEHLNLSPTIAKVPAQLSSPNVETIDRRRMGLLNKNIPSALGLHFQMDIVLILRHIAMTARVLTDSLELLFQLILRKANCVPVHALMLIASFYNSVGREDKAVLVAQTALKKIEGTDTETEFYVLHVLGQWHFDRGIYDQATIYFEREVAGRTRRFGEMNREIIDAKLMLGASLCNSSRVSEAEAVFLPLWDDSRSSSMKGEQLLDTLRWIGICRRRLGDPHQAITVLMDALNLQVTMSKRVSWLIAHIKLEIGWSWHSLKRYDQVMIWYGKALEPNGVEKTPARSTQYQAALLKGDTFYMTGKWDECLESLRLSLSGLQVLSTYVGVHYKSRVLKLLFRLGRKYFVSASYVRSLECFQLAHNEWVGSPKMKPSEDTLASCTFYCAASSYGLGNFGYGLELLRGIDKAPENPTQMNKEIQFLIQLGEQQLSTAESSSKLSSLDTASNKEVRRKESLDDLLQAERRVTDQDLRNTLQSLSQRIFF